jgi:hypothetical protein
MFLGGQCVTRFVQNPARPAATRPNTDCLSAAVVRNVVHSNTAAIVIVNRQIVISLRNKLLSL